MTTHDWIVAAIGAGTWIVASKIVDAGWPLLPRLRHPCRNGHDWQHRGGRNAACSKDCHCSVPVFECSRCPACDYGENAEATATMDACPTMRDVIACTCQFGYDEVGGVAYRAMDCPVHGMPDHGPMSHRCETCGVKDGHEPGCAENEPPDDLPDGLWYSDGRLWFSCRSCDHSTEFDGDPADFDPDVAYCGGSPRCCP